MNFYRVTITTRNNTRVVSDIRTGTTTEALRIAIDRAEMFGHVMATASVTSLD